MPLVKKRPVAKRKKKQEVVRPLGGNRRRRRPNEHPPRVRMSAANVKQPPPGQPQQPQPDPPASGPPPVFGSDLGNAQLKRLLWRAGFGPRPGDIDALAGKPIADVVRSLTRPAGDATLTGPAPHDDDGNPIAPADAWGHDHLWWLDRMIRSDQQLVERMTLIWHDWFATSNDGVGNQRMMLAQNDLFRSGALGSFKDLLLGVTADPAMLVWLNGIDNRRGSPNENYARELMELFTLGAGRGAYSEQDVRQLALALTGWQADWVDGTGWTNFRFTDRRHDHTTKSVFGKSGDFDWQDACRLVLENPFHASFFVTKLWSYFIPTPPSTDTQAALQQIYVDSGYGIRPVVEAILMHPDLYDGATMVKPPIVYNAGILRAMGRGIDREAWTWLGSMAGQQLFYPPNVSGWDDSAWLDTSRWKARFDIAVYATSLPGVWSGTVDPWHSATPYDKTEDGATAVARAIGFLNNPKLTSDTHAYLLAFAGSCLPATMRTWELGPFRAMRQNALRQLVATSPDFQTC
jgi:uncharacterized protein (DUF1800 family)